MTTKDIRDGAVTGDKVAEKTIDLTHINAELVVADDLFAAHARIDQLDAEKASIENLLAISAAIDTLEVSKASITDLTAQTGRIDTLYTDVGHINTILAKDVFAELAEIGQIVAGSSIIADGAIGSAQISDLDVAKLTGTIIDTAKFTVQGTDGKLKIQNNLLQVFDGAVTPFERIALGDLRGDGSIYGMVVRGADGTTILFDENGQTKEGFTDGYNKLDNDSLDPSKIDINRVISRINEDGTETFTASKILLDNETLDIKFTSMTQEVQDLSETVPYKVDIISTNGVVFKAGDIDSILLARVYKGTEDISDTIDANLFRWTRVSDDPDGDASWNASNFGGKKQIVLTRDDVLRRATFFCEILNN